MKLNQNNRNLLSVNSQARFLVSQSRQAQRNRQLSMLQRVSEEIGLNK
ncbi:hypothetical protein IQ238_18030 [Pleurocapsales cyanobacterium LEGE 06147]|nr:hypothetical protein [Pleurocapsales cyanobacterium LEGE 06147]